MKRDLAAPMTDMIGKTLGDKYRIIRLVGRGGMGIVYEAEHLVLHKRVAVKVLLPMYASQTQRVRRFIREGQAASAIEHPNILDIKDLCKDPDGTVYIVMELLRGRSLRRLLEQRRVLPLSQVVSISLELLAGLEAAHAKGVIHRDLKPENIFLSTAMGRDQVKIVDFGVAKFAEAAVSSLSLTETGSVPGTPFYMAPEQAQGGRHVDEQTDIWSVGVVMYEMLTGKVPFGGTNYNEVLSHILLTPLRPVQEFSADIPDELAAVVHKALSKDKAHRYMCAMEMIEALSPLRHSEDAAPCTTDVIQRDHLLATVRSVSADPPQSSTDLPAMTFSTPTLPQRSRRGLYLSAAAVLSILLIALFTFLKNDGSAMGRLPREADDRLMSPKAQPAPSASQAASAMSAKEEASKIAKEPPKTVVIKIDGLPAHAMITLNGAPSALPLIVSKSDDPQALGITAKGFLSYEQPIVPSHDMNLSIFLKKLPKRKAPQKKSNEASPVGGNKMWRSNPFGGE